MEDKMMLNLNIIICRTLWNTCDSRYMSYSERFEHNLHHNVIHLAQQAVVAAHAGKDEKCSNAGCKEYQKCLR